MNASNCPIWIVVSLKESFTFQVNFLQLCFVVTGVTICVMKMEPKLIMRDFYQNGAEKDARHDGSVNLPLPWSPVALKMRHWLYPEGLKKIAVENRTFSLKATFSIVQ